MLELKEYHVNSLCFQVSREGETVGAKALKHIKFTNTNTKI